MEQRDVSVRMVQCGLAANAAGCSATPAVLLVSGCFNPVHRGHTVLLQQGREAVDRAGKFTVVGAVVSPACDAEVQDKLGSLALPAKQRIDSMRRALEHEHFTRWCVVDSWEASQPERVDLPTNQAHLQARLDAILGTSRVVVLQLCGSDNASRYNLWHEPTVVAVVRSGWGGVPEDVSATVAHTNDYKSALSSTILRRSLACIELPLQRKIVGAITYPWVVHELLELWQVDIAADSESQSLTALSPSVPDEFADVFGRTDSELAGKTILVIGTGKYACVHQHAARLGVQIVIVCDPDTWGWQLLRQRTAAGLVPLSFDDVNSAEFATRVVELCREAHLHIDGVVSFCEMGVIAAARIANLMELPGDPVAAVQRARSKRATREVLGEISPRYATINMDHTALGDLASEELDAAVAKIGLPCVVKPTCGTGSIGVSLITDRAELKSACMSSLRELTTSSLNSGHLVGGMSKASLPQVEKDAVAAVRSLLALGQADALLQLEEYVEGVECDVDVVIWDGSCIYANVVENLEPKLPRFQENGEVCPPQHPDLDDDAQHTLRQLASRACQVIGLQSGVFHVEARFADDSQSSSNGGAYLLEVNARMGGGVVPPFHRLVWDVDLVAAALRCSVGVRPAISPVDSARRGVAVLDHAANISGTMGSCEQWAQFEQYLRKTCSAVKWTAPMAPFGATVTGIAEGTPTRTVRVLLMVEHQDWQELKQILNAAVAQTRHGLDQLADAILLVT